MSALDERPIAYSYVRMSSQQQIKGDSLRRQLELSEEYAKRNNLNLDNSLRDIGVSVWTGANVKTGALGRFLELVQTGRVTAGSYLLVESLDRLSRERVIDALEPFLSILRAGIIVITLADRPVYSAETVGDNFTQLMMSLAIMARAHEESQIKPHRISQAHARRRADAAKGHGKFSGQMWGWIDQVEVAPKKFEYRLNDHAKTVAKIFEMSDTGYGCLKIERELIRLNMMGIKGKPLSQGNINALLKNEAVIGTYQPTHVVEDKKVPYGEPLKNFLPAAVNENVYWRVRRNKRQPATRGRKGPAMTNLFPGLLTCGHCGARLMMSIGGSPKQRYLYVQCSRKYVGLDCAYPKGTFRYDVLEKAILDNVTEFQHDFSAGDPMKARSNLADQLSRNERKLAELEEQRANIKAMMAFAETDEHRRDIAADFASRRSAVEEAKAEIARLEIELQTFDIRRRESSEFADRIKIERMLWTTGDQHAIYDSRSRVALLIRKTLSDISVNFEKKEAMVLIGTERAYLFDKTGSMINSFDARKAGFYDTGTRYFATQIDDDGNEQIVALRPRPWGRREMTADIPVETIGEGENKQISPDTVEAQQDRIALIERLHETPSQKEATVNPRLNDPDVIALKERRRQGDLPNYHPGRKPHSK
ncbi:recombinase family protein [Rhizobium sp. BK379]|uniref:recombinase family protein n=1 Tax=Rhizobium sp. BK379 TaxID=2587059 RepID=UPI001619596C|nr:recombinase family protein [Rhizobium sp. BK379]MBB3445882.1 DNA invertase Pin-like site-specific DNA recombinase [Rhizobium sp. BK379]